MNRLARAGRLLGEGRALAAAKVLSAADVALCDPDTVVVRAPCAAPGLYVRGVSHMSLGGRVGFSNGALQPERFGAFPRLRDGARQLEEPTTNTPSRP